MRDSQTRCVPSPQTTCRERGGVTKRPMRGGNASGNFPAWEGGIPTSGIPNGVSGSMGPYAPLLVDTGAARARGIHGARLEAEAAESRDLMASSFIDLIDIHDELRERPPKSACVVYRAAHFSFFGIFARWFCLVFKKLRRAAVVTFSFFLDRRDSVVSFSFLFCFCAQCFFFSICHMREKGRRADSNAKPIRQTAPRQRALDAVNLVSDHVYMNISEVRKSISATRKFR